MFFRAHIPEAVAYDVLGFRGQIGFWVRWWLWFRLFVENSSGLLGSYLF
jgi:hypothetical protein